MGQRHLEEMLDIVSGWDAWFLNEGQGGERFLLAQDLMARKHCRVSGHLYSTELSDVREGFAEVFSTVLRGMVAQDTSEDNEAELFSLCGSEYVFSSHVHEANVAEVSSDLILKHTCKLSAVILIGRCRLASLTTTASLAVCSRQFLEGPFGHHHRLRKTRLFDNRQKLLCIAFGAKVILLELPSLKLGDEREVSDYKHLFVAGGLLDSIVQLVKAQDHVHVL